MLHLHYLLLHTVVSRGEPEIRERSRDSDHLNPKPLVFPNLNRVFFVPKLQQILTTVLADFEM